MSEAALAPKMGPATEEERAAFVAWRNSTAPSDAALHLSISKETGISAQYIFIRALRASVPLEKLL